ncbi:hypothetical protein NMY22_g7953 [Coprinellus aureogranulatus]|nr:hypothetical protein NMY22_g7953 [Coprinellus aureogranulatus]
MPSVPLRQKLLQDVFAYARRLQELRRLKQRFRRSVSSGSTSDGSPSDSNGHGGERDAVTDSDSSLSSMSTFSTVSSLDSDSDSGVGNADLDVHPFSDQMDEEEEEWEKTKEYLKSLAAIRARIEFLSTTRVLHPNTVHKLSQLYLVLVLYRRDDPYRFRRNLRVSPSTFDGILTQIQDHEVFLSTGIRPQLPVDEQLAIALKRFGNFGSNASVEAIAQWAGVSAGMVVAATQRVMEAVLSLHDRHIHWPDARAKEEAKEYVEAATCVAWRDGWVFVDGTLIPLAEKPAYHGESYFDRKSNYSLNVQLITLPNLKIVDYVLGHCGSAHDSSVFMDSRLYRNHQELLAPGEWIWADSAYPIEAWCITPYKKPAALIPENRTFNFWVSHIRIRSEHAVGYVKGRFQSLRGLRQQIVDKKAHERALVWVRTCLVLHNMIQDIESGEPIDEEWEEQLMARADLDGNESGDEGGGGVAASRARESRGQRKRREVQEWLFASGLADRGRGTRT